MRQGYRVYYDFSKEKWFCEAKKVEFNKEEVSVVNFYEMDYNEAVVVTKDHNENIVVKTCIACGKPFIISNDQINWFLDRKLKEPRRCVKCRKLAKAKADVG